MRALLQRASAASVSVDGEVLGSIGWGWVVLLGVAATDTEAVAGRLAARIVNLRGFDDEAGRLNRSLLDISGSALVVSQVTLYADTAKGRRPSFNGAAPLDLAEHLVDHLAASLRTLSVHVECGRFRAHMVVHVENDGPVTFLLAQD